MFRINFTVVVLFIVICLGFSASAYPATYYVDPSGSDGNPGTEAKPWAMIVKANNTLVFSTTELVSLNQYETQFIEFSPDWVAGGGNYTIQITTMLAGDEYVANNVTANVVFVEGPTLSYDPTSYNAGMIMVNETDSTSFDIWNSGVGTLTYTLSETCSWINL